MIKILFSSCRRLTGALAAIGSLLVAVHISRGAEVEPPPVGAPTTEIQREFALDPFYTKCLVTGGFPVVGSQKVSDYAMREAAYLVDRMLDGRDDIRAALIRQKVRLAVMAASEFTTDIPEHRTLEPARYWNRRARGLGASHERPAVSCAEENLLEYEGDPYIGENILVHEFAHAVHLMGVNAIDDQFDRQLAEAYGKAINSGLWKETYAATNKEEYWAEGVQSWFHCNRTNVREHNHIGARAQLVDYDPDLARLIVGVFRDNPWEYVTPSARKSPEHLTGFTREGAPKFAWPAELATGTP